jgi:enoyl-CoA hydratase/carnithine racemase
MSGDGSRPTHADVAVELGTDRVAVLEIRRPPNNFFDVSLLEQLVDACDLLATSDDCRAIILCSEGRHFCAGADFAHGDPGKGPGLYDVAFKLFEQPLPIVAAIQGAAIGGGLGLALVADVRVAAPEARFSANFARLGFHHGFGLSATLPAVVGHQAAIDLLYTGRRITAEEAQRIGLCDHVVPADALREHAHKIAAEIAGSAPLAVRAIRRTMRSALVEQVRAALVVEHSEQQRLKQTDDWQEGIAAMTERRTPQFRGR